MKEYILGMDIGGTNTRLGLVDSDYKLYDFLIERSEELQLDNDTIGNLIRIIESYIEKFGKDRKIIAISAGFPSTIDRDRQEVLSTPNIKGLDNIRVVKMLEQKFQIPVYIETDVNMLILYDIFKNQLSDRGIVCGIYLGTGLGNAVVINGELLIGRNGAAAELGHIPVRGVKGKCGCGNESCIELIASGYKLREIVEKSFSDTCIGDVFTKYSDSIEIKQFVDDLAMAIATEINILDPDYIVLGGGLTKMLDFPFAMMETAIYKYVRKPFPAESLSYIYSEQGQDNGVVGAGILALRKLKKGN